MSAEYDKYLLEHINNVRTCYKLLWGENLEEHDASKYSEEEYKAYDAHFYHTGECTEADYNRAWLHHIHNNPHHWQHWVILEDEGTVTTVKMSNEAFKEMIADWTSFCLDKNDAKSLLNWYKTNRKTILMDDKTKAMADRAVVYAYNKVKNYLENQSTSLTQSKGDN